MSILGKVALIAGAEIARMTGSFGAIAEPEEFTKHEIKGTHKITSLGESQPKKSKGRHRRQYLSGKKI